MRAAVLQDDLNLAAILATVFELAGIALARVDSVGALLEEVATMGDRDFVVLDCSRRYADEIEMVGRIIRRVRHQVHVIHPSRDFVHDLGEATGVALTGLEPDFRALSLLGKLRTQRLGAAGRDGDAAPVALTESDRQLLLLLTAGLSNPAIQREMHISRSTLGARLQSLKAKLHVDSRAALIVIGSRLTQDADDGRSVGDEPATGSGSAGG